jgi:hypothetical protein
LVRSLIENGSVLIAEDSTNPNIAAMQNVINEMSGVVSHMKPPQCLAIPEGTRPFETPPKLLIHRYHAMSRLAPKAGIGASGIVPEYIDINTTTRDHFVDKPLQFKALMAHELGHIGGFDLSAEGQAKWRASPPNQKREILAEKLAAIIFGNPMEYAKESSKLQFRFNKKYNIPNDLFSDEYLSANENARMQHKWADLLQREKALDNDGNVIMEPDENGHMMPLKALAIFERSRDFTEDYLGESLKFGVSHPAPTSRDTPPRR